MKPQFHFSESAWERNNTRLTNQIFKLLPMFENGEDWDKQLSTIVLELHGYNAMFESNSDFMVLIAKLLALRNTDGDQIAFRKLVFEAISQIKEIKIL